MSQASPPLQLVALDELPARRVLGFLGAFYGFDGAQTDAPGAFKGTGFAAIAGEGIVGLATIALQPSLVAEESLGFLSGAVERGFRRRGLGRRLTAKTLEAASAAVGRLFVWAQPPEPDADAGAAFLRSLGFLPADEHNRYEVELSETIVPPPQPRFLIREYAAGDPLLDAAIASLHRQAYRSRAGVPELHPTNLASSEVVCLLAFEGKALIGQSTLIFLPGQTQVESLVVARSHWGSGAAEALSGSIVQLSLARGCRRLAAYVTSSNRASVALIERVAPGARRVAIGRRFTLSPGSSAAPRA